MSCGNRSNSVLASDRGANPWSAQLWRRKRRVRSVSCESGLHVSFQCIGFKTLDPETKTPYSDRAFCRPHRPRREWLRGPAIFQIGDSTMLAANGTPTLAASDDPCLQQ